jgi:O-antigen ligase
MLAPTPFDYLYWPIAYLASFIAMKIYISSDDMALRNAVYLNYYTWIITTIFLLIMVIAARDELIVGTGLDTTGYGIESRKQSVVEVTMSRSSGISRFAAVPGVVAFAYFWITKRWYRILWLIPFGFSCFLIYVMQSRGTTFSFGFALAFVLVFMGQQTRRAGMVLLFIFGVIVLADLISAETLDKIANHLTRGENPEQLTGMTGRTISWSKAWPHILNSPIWGWGFQSDRYLMGEHVHNTFYYALLTSGFFGTTFFVLGIIQSWRLFFKVLNKSMSKNFLVQAGAILAFFTLRSIPEVSGSMFGVDFIVMLPILGYLTVLDRYQRRRNLSNR